MRYFPEKKDFPKEYQSRWEEIKKLYKDFDAILPGNMHIVEEKGDTGNILDEKGEPRFRNDIVGKLFKLMVDKVCYK